MRELEVVPLGTQATLDDAFARSLRACYGEYGVSTVAKPIPASQREHVRLVIVRDRNGDLAGGARVHAHRGKIGFPAEGPLTHFPDMHAKFAALAHDGSVELAAMWTAPSAKRTGLARLVAQASIACAIALGKRLALTFSHQHFEHVLFPIGMRPVRGVAPIGFPTPAYRSRVYVADLTTLRTAARRDRDIIFSMAACFGAGMASLALEQMAHVEHGGPSFTIRTEGVPIQRAVS
jgi:GNAT superfamily N-acetyltransferase